MSEVLIVVDVQNGFCNPNGSVVEARGPLEGVQEAIHSCVSAVEKARRAQVPVIFTRHVYRPGYVDAGRNVLSSARSLAESGGLLSGSWDAGIVDELHPLADDVVVEKCRFDPFLWTSLDLILNQLGVSKVTACGVVTNACVESTIRAAYMRDYETCLLADACAAPTRRLHEIALEVLGAYQFAEIVEHEGWKPGSEGSASAPQ